MSNVHCGNYVGCSTHHYDQNQAHYGYRNFEPYQGKCESNGELSYNNPIEKSIERNLEESYSSGYTESELDQNSTNFKSEVRHNTLFHQNLTKRNPRLIKPTIFLKTT